MFSSQNGLKPPTVRCLSIFSNNCRISDWVNPACDTISATRRAVSAVRWSTFSPPPRRFCKSPVYGTHPLIGLGRVLPQKLVHGTAVQRRQLRQQGRTRQCFACFPQADGGICNVQFFRHRPLGESRFCSHSCETQIFHLPNIKLHLTFKDLRFTISVEHNLIFL